MIQNERIIVDYVDGTHEDVALEEVVTDDGQTWSEVCLALLTGLPGNMIMTISRQYDVVETQNGQACILKRVHEAVYPPHPYSRSVTMLNLGGQ